MTTALPHPVYFVLRYADKWRRLIEASAQSGDVADADALYRDIASNEECWVLSTYLRLRPKLSNVYLTDRAAPGAICVVSGLDFGIRDARLGSFYIGARSDGPAPALCQLSVVQNALQASRGQGVFIAHWPQPGLLPRDRARGHRVENVVFYGNETNLDARFREAAFMRGLQARGLHFCIRGGGAGTAVDWNDYTRADVVLAVRNLTEADALTKPASKLVNAWLAGVPAILGPEPAFRELRRSELDYFEAKTAADVLAAIDRLMSNAPLYEACIANGQARSGEFSVDAVTSRWMCFLGGDAARAFEAWSARSVVGKSVAFVANAAAHKAARARADVARAAGRRILELP